MGFAMQIRKAKLEDLPEIMEIYSIARGFMAENGNPTQWGSAYPPREMIEEDIRDGCSYVWEGSEGLEGVFYFKEGEDPSYVRIENGAWLNEDSYGAIHRVASRGRQKGMLAACVEWCWQRCKNLKIDTHEDNHVMQNALEKNGFVRCGRIYVEDRSPRIAYQKAENAAC